MDHDRISQLPEPILHHILSFLSQKDAVKTSLLSTSWRYVWCNRPIFQFSETVFRRNFHKLHIRKSCHHLSFLDTALQRYYDQKLCIREFVVDMWPIDSESISLFEKWIPIVSFDLCVQKFHLSFWPLNPDYFDLPSIVFKAESLKELSLKRCRINPFRDDYVLLSKNLNTLSLAEVYIEDETFAKIMSSCPLIEHVTLDECQGLKNIKVHHNAADYNLKSFYFRHYNYRETFHGSIEIQTPSIETINVEYCSDLFHNHKYFPNLTCLILTVVRIDSKSFEITSRNFPNLKDLTFSSCYGFEEFHLSSHSIKSLLIRIFEPIKKATVDVPNLVGFEYEGHIPRSISFAKINNSRQDWKSYITVRTRQVDLSWFLNLYAMLDALSQSEIFLVVSELFWTDDPSPPPYGGLLNYKPVVVELMDMVLRSDSLPRQYSDYVNNMFRICRPRKISGEWYPTEESKREREYELSDFQYEILVMERKEKDTVWQQELEEVSMEILDKNTNEWNRVQWKGLSESELRSIKYRQLIRLCLNWRDHF